MSKQTELIPVMSAQEVTSYLREIFPQSDSVNWKIDKIDNGFTRLISKTGENDLRPGGTISGPTMMTLADIAAYICILAHIGKVSLAVTTCLNINFLSKPPQADLIADCNLIKLGKRLAICEVHISSAKTGRLVAQATVTYSIPR